MKHITSQEYDALAVSSNLLVIDFYATWCGPCKMLAPVFEEVADKYPDVTFVKVNVDEDEELARKFRISVIPTLVFVKNGEAVKTSTGYMDADALSALVDAVL
jgi:thioredoxin 1